MNGDLSKISLDVTQKIDVAAAVGDVYRSLLAQLTTESGKGDNRPMPMVLEEWPGGRWFRDLGPGQGHLWGFVQVIKPPTLLEIHGPLFMSYAATSHVQFRLTQASGGTTLSLRHRAIGMIEEDHRKGVTQGWQMMLNAIKGRCE
jgi:Activator of Hsp90 ATPase homolog 1-like protein